MRKLLIFTLLVAAVAGAVLMTKMRPEPPKTERPALHPLVEVFELKEMTARFEIHSQGTVKPRTETVLSAEIAGTITKISPKFIPGGVFRADEVLMRIDPTNYEVAVKQAEALVNQRQIEYDGAKKLRTQGYRAETEYASSAAALASAEAELVRAQRNLERTYIRLPYEGIVRSKETDLGQFVSPGTRLGVVFATDYAEVRLPLTDVDLAYIKLPDASAVSKTGSADGPPVTLAATQRGQTVTWPAQIVRTEGVVDEKSRVTYAVARIPDPYRLHTPGDVLPMGTFVAATIEGSAAENIISVPRTLVRGSDELILVNDNDKLEIRTVNIVRSDANYVYINGGAQAGERVVATALDSPVNGMTVRIAPTSGSP